MNTEERLAKAEDIIKKLVFDIGHNIASVKEAKEFLNPKPEIDWSQVPVGTFFKLRDDPIRYYFWRTNGTDVKNIADISFPLNDCTIPSQSSHIHKCPWPEDGKQPEWVKGDDLILTERQIIGSVGPVQAKHIAWDYKHTSKPVSKWFAVLQIAEYWK